ncbi:putative monocarboxylate transporter [Schistosoma mansoni]|uniref:putative monocarboxylate transporter n=1 Tax=Schistosoma mansoni TaxID=6183 RepID=UPI0001A64006|nr:putative monocarboxylate transporter [Schistosoma mansoni]|eukprot:XP_018653991.1 putative monocarboxylate transporter [Schistosoma mansoni]
MMDKENTNAFKTSPQMDCLEKLAVSLPSAAFSLVPCSENRDFDTRFLNKFQSGRKGCGMIKSSRTLSEPTLPTSKSLKSMTTSNFVSPTFARYMPYFLSSLSDHSSSSTTMSSISVSNLSDASSSVRLPLSPSQLSLPEPPDGGWGWVVVIATFFVHMITDGVIVSFGVFIESLVEEFQDSMSATSWIGSFSYGIPALAAPLSSLLLNRFGCRVTCMVGGLISGLGCFAGAFTNSIISMVFSFGILSGLGASLCITSALVVVSMYFDNRRATATGLSIAGTGVGALVFAPMVDMLLNIYTWRGAMMILSGFFLNMIVCGALMRPVETDVEKRHRQRLAWLEHLARESGLPPFESADYLDKDVLGRIKLLRDHMLAPRRVTMSYLHSTNEINDKLISDVHNQTYMLNDCCETTSLKFTHNTSQSYNQNNIPRGSSSSLLECYRSAHQSSVSLPDLHHLRRVYKTDNSSESGVSSQCSLGYKCSCLASRKSELKSVDEGEKCQDKEIYCCNCCTEMCADKHDIFHRLFDLRLFRRPTFVLFMVSNFLLYFWYNVTYFFMGVRAINYGLSETLAALLFSVLGGANMVGEVLAGFLADRDGVDSLTLYFFMILACGVSTCLMPLLTTFMSMAVYSSVFGMGLAANDALCTVLLVEFVGLHRLTNGLGICFFCQGVANILGPPLIGYIIDLTQSHDPAFIISGLGMVLAAFSVVPIIIQHFRRRRARRLRRLQQNCSEIVLEAQT